MRITFLVVMLAIAPATFAASVTGVAVSGIDSATQVGSTRYRRALDGRAIRYFVPLSDNSGTYGVGNSCGGSGFGTCSDRGDGGGHLDLFLRFDGLNPDADGVLSVLFEDLDVAGVNDPSGFVETINVFSADGQSLTGNIDTLDSLFVSGDSGAQLLRLGLGLIGDNPFFVRLRFRSESEYFGRNTAEFLIAKVSEVPIPAALPLMLSGLAGIAFFRRRRKAKGLR